MLKEQGYQVDSVPEEGQIVYLRENSNISTGGDSIDVTDDFNDDYKQVAVDAVAALQASISGIDLIIPDKTKPANEPGLMESLKPISTQRCICTFIHTAGKADA